MTHKEKAEELTGKYWDNVVGDCDCSWERSKQCALIAVDEIMLELSNEDMYLKSNYIFWQEVKNEIEKL